MYGIFTYAIVKVDGATLKFGGLVSHDKHIHGSCAIYFPVWYIWMFEHTHLG